MEDKRRHSQYDSQCSGEMIGLMKVVDSRRLHSVATAVSLPGYVCMYVRAYAITGEENTRFYWVIKVR